MEVHLVVEVVVKEGSPAWGLRFKALAVPQGAGPETDDKFLTVITTHNAGSAPFERWTDFLDGASVSLTFDSGRACIRRLPEGKIVVGVDTQLGDGAAAQADYYTTLPGELAIERLSDALQQAVNADLVFAAPPAPI